MLKKGEVLRTTYLTEPIPIKSSEHSNKDDASGKSFILRSFFKDVSHVSLETLVRCPDARYRLPGRDLEVHQGLIDCFFFVWCTWGIFYHRIHHLGNMFRFSKHQTKLFQKLCIEILSWHSLICFTHGINVFFGSCLTMCVFVFQGSLETWSYEKFEKMRSSLQ